ncbi:FtsX-like permease family protein OS=Streptomyces tendae OX=1932 GN=GUR47_09040 PE=3 SV=1 [Streptomyces tendae]
MPTRSVLGNVEHPLVVDERQSSYGVRATEPPAPEKWLPRPDGLPAAMVLAAPQELEGHARLRSGRLPRLTGGRTGASSTELEAAVTEETARTLRMKAGSRRPRVRTPRAHRPHHRRPRARAARRRLLVRRPRPAHPVPAAGAGTARRPRPLLLGGRPAAAPGAGPALLGSVPVVRYRNLAPDPQALHGRDLGPLTSAVASLESGPALQRLQSTISPVADVSTGLDDVFATYGQLRDDTGPLVAVAASGAGTVAAVVLLMAGGLAGERRRAELALLRARGASVRGIAGRLLAETAVVAVPAGALGLGVALLALPGARLLPALWAALAVTALACLTLPLRAAVAHHRVRIHDGRRDAASPRASRRRTVAELTVGLALGAVAVLRRRGATDGAGDLVAMAPVLVGVIAALVLVRLYPLPLRRLARPAQRLRGAVGPLALARAGRTSASTLLPLLALLTAFTVAAFGGSVLSGMRVALELGGGPHRRTPGRQRAPPLNPVGPPAGRGSAHAEAAQAPGPRPAQRHGAEGGAQPQPRTGGEQPGRVLGARRRGRPQEPE